MELQIFNSEFGKVRAMMIDGEPYFVGKDVAEAPGYSDTASAIRQHVDVEDKKMGGQNTHPSIVDNLGRKQYPTIINESGIYSLAFASKLPTAKKFKHWVTIEVLPAIRKPDGTSVITRTTVVTGKGQQYFINKFLDGTMKVVCA